MKNIYREKEQIFAAGLLLVKDMGKYWHFEKLNGYQPLTLFYTDFSVSEDYGADAVQETFEYCFQMAISSGIAPLTELVLVLMCKAEEVSENDAALAKIYEGFWKKVDDYVCDNFKGYKLYHYYKILNLCRKLK